jgi:hypothetical protein
MPTSLKSLIKEDTFTSDIFDKGPDPDSCIGTVHAHVADMACDKKNTLKSKPSQGGSIPEPKDCSYICTGQAYIPEVAQLFLETRERRGVFCNPVNVESTEPNSKEVDPL